MTILHHRVPFDGPAVPLSVEAEAELRRQRKDLILEVDRLRRGSAVMERELDQLRAENAHLRRQIGRPWWRRQPPPIRE